MQTATLLSLPVFRSSVSQLTLYQLKVILLPIAVRGRVMIEVVGQYQFEESPAAVLGRGTYGVVFRGCRTKDRAPVAIKRVDADQVNVLMSSYFPASDNISGAPERARHPEQSEQ